ncbi:unnamed protein product, partial [Rodentolepis nana]|uniref:WAPL domain-containing protein n=1 Tax=Rodentolepis nana TaxID=102285 RepID=A0A0R3T680_RODNA
MNGDITKIPVLSCGAVKQLSDIFPELPLPSACTDGVSNDTLICDQSLSNDVEQALNSNNEALISNVSDALSMVSTQNIDLVDETVAMPIDNANAPPILNFLLQRNSRVFNQECASSSHPNRANFNFNWDPQANPNGLNNQHIVFDEDSSVKHQHKRKKRKRRKVGNMEQEIISDGESNGVSVSDWDSGSDNEPSARKSYEIKNTGGEALKLKISIKRAAPVEISTSDNSLKERKEKKHKKSKDKRRHHSRDKSLPSSEGRSEQPLIPPTNGIPMTAKPMLVTSPPKEIFNSQRPPGSSASHSPHQFPFDLQGVFDQTKPDFSTFPINLFDDLSVPHSNAAPNHSMTNSVAAPFSYNDFLPPDLLSSTNIPPALPSQHAHNPSPQTSVYQGNFMVASHLDYSDNTHPDYPTSYGIGQTTTTVAPMGLASYLNSTKPQTISNNPPTSQPTSSVVRSSAPVKPSARRRPPVPKRRRANEVEGLRSWTVKYPGQKNPTEKNATADESSAWDAVVDRQANYLRKKRRLTRQPTALANDYVLENDKDYPKPLTRRNSFGDNDVDESGIGGDNDDTDDHLDPEGGKGVASISLRSSAARCSYAGMDEEGEDIPDEECYKDSSTRRRRKATDDDDAPFEVRIKEPAEQRFPHLQKVTADRARPIRERVHHKPLNAYSEVLGGESASASSLKKFLSHIDHVLEAVEEVDLLAGGENDDGIPQEAIISPADIAELVRDSAKLKSIQAANQVPTDRLLKLLTLLLLNIRDGVNVVRITGDQESMEKISRAVGASLIALNLMTSKDMPREIYLEDVIEQAVQVTRFQLSNCIYPEYDPAYRIENTAKDNQSSIKSRRARERDIHKSTAVVHLYHRLVEVVSGLSELVHIQRLTDSLILSLCTVGVSIFFVENVSELQLSGLKLVPALYAHYHMCRQLVTEELISGIARLPSSKRNLRTYRLNSEESIQMFTALSLLLVQSLIELPTVPSFGQQSKDKQQQEYLEQHQNSSAVDSTSSLHEIKPDDEVLVVSSYKRAVLTAHNFLASFLRKSTTRGEDDYRMIFENFVNDLLLTVNKPEWPAAEVMLSLLGSLLVQQFNNKSLDQSVRVTSVDYLGTVASTLRRDAVTSQLKEHDIDVILRELTEGSQSDSEDEEELGGEQEDESHKIEKGTSYLKPEEGQQKPST